MVYLEKNAQALDGSKGSDTEVIPKDREITVKERGGPPKLREDEDDGLEDDQ